MRLFRLSAIRNISNGNRGMGQRYLALFFVSVFWLSLLTPTASAITAINAKEKQFNSKDTHSKPFEEESTTKEHDFNYPSGMKPSTSSQIAAEDAAGPVYTDKDVLGRLGNASKPAIGEGLKSIEKAPEIKPHELTDRRSSHSTSFLNKDGSITEKKFFEPQFYKKQGKWSDIDNTLKEDKNAGDSGNIFGKAYGQMQSWLSSPTNFTSEENDWQARFSPSDAGNGMVRIKKGDSQIGYAPLNAKKVAPVITTDKDGNQKVNYYDLWPGVNVEYIVTSGSVKENIILKDKDATSKVAFEVLGAKLEKQKDGSLKVEGALDEKFAIAKPNLILNNFSFETKPVLKQDFANGVLSVSVDEDYLRALPAKAFPAVIDPSTFYDNFGTRAGGDYVSVKSDGYVCYSTECNPYAGSLYDTNNVLRYWRSGFYANYDQFKDPNKVLTNATLHLKQRSNESFWTGTWAAHTYYVGYAACRNGFNCLANGVNASGSVAGAGDINVTSIYQSRIASGDFGTWLMLTGEDGTYDSFKNFDPGTGGTSGSYVAFTYGGPPSAPAVASPRENQVYVDPQPSFSVNSVSNPNGSAPMQYEMLVSTGPGGAGALVTSGKQFATQWTVPDGVLQDGSTYYVQARSFDSITGTYSDWGTSVPFRIDMRTGKDKSQTYDSLGPVGVNLATGNLTTSAASHSSTALGGELGINLEYNSPLRSRNGLVGEYFNNTTFSGSSVLKRVDQQVNFNWQNGSPGSGVNDDNFGVIWNGYFVAPKTGTYYFGGLHNDALRVFINGTGVYINNSPTSGSTPQYGISGVSLQEGEVARIKVENTEYTGSSMAMLYVKGAVDEQVMPNNWLQTGVRPVASKQGLTGSYYAKLDGTNTFSANNPLVMRRTDPYMSFSWKGGSPVAGGPSDFLVRWSGYITAPVSGTYTFGSRSDDGAKVKLGTGNTVVVNDWNLHTMQANTRWDSTFSMTAGVPVPITIEYFDSTDYAQFELWVKNTSAGISDQIVPSSWLTTTANPLPDGWSIGQGSGSGISYDHLTANQNSAVLTDSSGDTHEYKWTGSAYTPPLNEDGTLTRNADGSFTLQDVDGLTYVFGIDGTISSVTGSVDDRNPVALQYEYQTQQNSQGQVSGPVQLTKIKDGVDPSRTATLYYSGDSNCAVAPSGFDASAPSGMLCAVKTNDGHTSNFFYISGQLARIQLPGNLNTDYRYEQVNNSAGQLVGYRMNAIRDSLAMDAVAAGVRSNNDEANTQITYDDIGRAVTVKQPAPTAGATRIQHNIEYLPGAKSYVDSSGNAVPGYAGMTKEHVVGASEPHGFTTRIKYDDLFRTIESTDITNQSAVTEWDTQKDLVYSTTNALGQKSTTVYDHEDRPVSSYGPAPKAWFDTTDQKNQVPLSAYASQVARSDVAYDEGLKGLAITTYGNKKLTGAPTGHRTALDNTGDIYKDLQGNSLVPSNVSTTGWGMRFTGRIKLAEVGSHTFEAYSDDGMRVYIDDKKVIDDWTDGVKRTHPTGTFNNVTANSWHRITIDYYDRGNGDAWVELHKYSPNGGTKNHALGSIMTPDYSLATSAKSYDSTLGNTTVTTNYGANPELGQVQSATVDPTGLNLTASANYETQGATGSFLRQTNSVTPGNTSSNPTATYAYYGATETRDNPCTTGTTEAYKQAGMLKTSRDASPDGGTTAGIVGETVYDDAGRIVATRTNSDSWTCTTYDSRGRVSTVTVPAFNGEAARTTNYDYAVGGNPLVTTTWDDNGWIVRWVDLLGRTTKYRDVHDDETTTTYDQFGKVTQRVSPVGTEVYEYDTYSRLTNQKLDGTTYATVSYDQYSRVDHVDYPNAGQMKATPGYDTLLRPNSVTYQMGDGTTSITDTATYTQSGKVLNDVVSSGSNQLWSTFGYDGAGRLTSADIGPHTYSYGYGAQNSTCGAGANMNANSGKNGNRTSQTINGVTTAYCYDYADRLVSSSDPTANYAEYDSHGNMTYLGTGSTPLRMCYDSSDRNYCLVSYNSSGTGNGMYYTRDVAGRITYREHDTITNWNWNIDGQYWYGYTGDGDGSSFIKNASSVVIEKTIQLLGGVMMTIKPQQTGNNQKQYSMSGALGRTLLTANAAGTNTSTGNGPLSSFTYDPYGNVLPGSTLPSNTEMGSYGYAGNNQKVTETTIPIGPIQMGARVYLPGIGRFTSLDPVPGGNVNGYAYTVDPINGSDYSGMSCLQSCGNVAKILQPARTIVQAPSNSSSRLQNAAYSHNTSSRPTIRIPAKPASPPAKKAAAPKPRNNSTALPAATVNSMNIATIGSKHGMTGAPAYYGVPASKGGGVSISNGIDSGISYFNAGKTIGAGVGCGVGAVLQLEVAPVACGAGAVVVAGIAAPTFALWGFISGSMGLPGANAFDGWEDTSAGLF